MVKQKMKRPIIEIDRDKCNGCGLCTTACAENALVLDDENKAVLVRELYCDGLGACLDVCPTGALQVVEREVEAYDPEKAYRHVKNTRGEEAAREVHGYEKMAEDPAEKPVKTPRHFGGCPGTQMREIKRETEAAGRGVAGASMPESSGGRTQSELTQWPVQLRLVSPAAPYFEGCDLLLAADCTAFALGSFHQDLLKGKKVAIACPKLDDSSTYVEKLAQIIGNNTIYSITVAIMSVPCCSGLSHMVDQAVALSGKNIAVKKIVVDINGEMTV